MDVVMSNKQTKHQKIMNVVKEKDLEGFKKQLKGIKGVAKTLKTDINDGIDNDEKKIAQRRKNFGSNAYKKPPPEGFLRTAWRPLQEFAILNKLMNILAALILFLAATAVGSYVPSAHNSKDVMMDGDKIEVLRGARKRKISTSEIVVGDVVCLKIGDKVPADGLFLKGQNLLVEDGESAEAVQVNEQNPFLFSGSQVVDGFDGCQMMVTTVGMKAKWCETMSQHSHDGKIDEEEEIPTVENRVNQLIRSIRNKLALPVAVIGSVVVLVRYFTGTTKDMDGNQEFINGHAMHGDFFGSSVLKFVTAAFVTVVVAIPESLRLCLPLTVFYSKKRMMADMEMVSDLSSWEKMPFVTTICTDKTGTLSMNQMKVEKFWVGKYSLVNEAYFSNVSDSVKKLLEEGIALNTSSSARNSTTPTDKAILSWAVHELEMDMGVKSKCKVVNHAAFDSRKKRSGVLMEREVDKTVHVHWKGEAEVILGMCSSYYDASGTTKDLDAEQKLEFQRIIQVMKSSLQCTAFAHNNIIKDQPDGNSQTLKEDGLVLLALVGIKDPSLPEMKAVVEDCQKAAIDVKMFTGNDVSMAKDIARGCGILSGTPSQEEEGEVIKGEQFQVYSPNERNEKVDKIRVMANSSPDDKLLMVKTLKKQGHIVAVCGNTTNGDAWAMIEADVGISMGIRGGTGAGGFGVSSKKISDIVILDGNFALVPKVVRSSIGIYNNIQKFIQFQLTLNLATLAVFFISAIAAGEIPLNSSHVLWLNLIINTLAALALATEKPTEVIRNMRPLNRGRKQKVPPFISMIMWRNILGQVVYQIAVVLVLLFEAYSIFGIEYVTVRNSLIFNAFMLCQVFNEFNARNIENIKSVFKGIHKDIPFLLVIAVSICVQMVFVEFFLYRDRDYFERLELREWSICFGFAVISWPIDWIVKCIPVREKSDVDEV